MNWMNYLYATKSQRDKRKIDMINLRDNKLCTLQQIADIHSISRERVRQIIGNTGRDFVTRKTKALLDSVDLTNLTTSQISKLPGNSTLWKKRGGKVRHLTAMKGIEFEYFANEILISQGIKNKLMPFGCPFDILTHNEIKIDVKLTDCDISNAPSQISHVYTCYSIGHLKGGSDCDFFFVFIPDKRESIDYATFIIPSALVPKAKDTRIRIPWPCMTKKRSKWHKYLNRFDLLSEAK